MSNRGSPYSARGRADEDDDLDRARRGDRDAFGRLVRRHQRRVYAAALHILGNHGDADDATQEAFVRAYRGLGSFDGRADFFTWLYRIAVNTAKKALVDLKRDPLVSENALRGGGDDEDETSAVENELTTAETPETVLAAKEIAATVNSAMEALPEELRQAVTLREIEGLSYEEIAEVMNCPIGTVRSRIFRAREAISAKVRPMLENQSGKRW